jgi:DNA modification methylase
MILEQEKLDVIAKSRSNLFNWRGQFTPEFVEYILTSFAKEGDHIFDPFSGSGTVLQESARLGLTTTGFEINPSAYAMSKFFSFCNLTNDERNNFCISFEEKLKIQLQRLNGQKVYVESQDYREAYINLLAFAVSFDHLISSKQERIFFINILFQSEKDRKLTVAESIFKSFQYSKNCLLNLPYSINPVNSKLLDARSSGDELTNSVDLILTSPPYINVFNYHQNYRAIIETFNFDILKVAHSEFGSNRKNRGNRFKTVIQYCIDMELAIRSFWKALKPNSKMILIVGRESNVRGTPFYNGQLVIEIIEKSNGFSGIKTFERQFTNKFGVNIKEDIIISTKTSELSNSLNGRTIAISHLERSLIASPNGVHVDLSEAILNSSEVKESPIFNPKFILKK